VPYRANLGGQFGGGAGPPAVHPIDIGGALDSLTSGASTLIQNAYMRKQAQAKLALDQQQRDTEAQRYSELNTRDVQRYSDEQAARVAQNQRQTLKDQQDHEYRMAEVARQARDSELKARAQGITPGSTTISRQPDVPPPAVQAPPIAQAFSQGNLSAGGPAAPSSLTAPVAPGSMGSVPRLNVSSTQDEYNPDVDPRVARIDEQNQGRFDVAQLRAASQERIGRNHDAARAAIHTEIGSRPITETARTGHILKLSAQYQKKTYSGGLGLGAADAEERATQDVDNIIASQHGGGKKAAAPAPVAAPPASPGNVNLGDPAAAGVSFPAPAADPIGVAVQHLRKGTGTLAQLDASDASPAFKAAVKQRMGVRSP
jgi:hypothetical protein